MPTPPTATEARRPAPTPARRRGALVTLGLGVIAALVVWGAGGWGRDAGSDGAATAISSTPANGEALPVAPASLSLTFATPVTAGPAGVTVADGDGRRVDQGVTTRPAPNQLRVSLAPDLPDGTYRADYRVLDPAGDVLVGYVAFGVGPPPDPAVVERLAPPPDRLGGAWTTLATALLLVGVLGSVGLAVFAVVVVPDSAAARRRLVPWVRGGVLAGVAGAAGVVVGRSAAVTGEGLGSVGRSGVVGTVLRQGGTGWWLVGLVVGLAVITVGVGVRTTPVRQALVVYGALVAAGSFALTGHAAVGTSVVAGISTAVHVAVGALWLGGVTGLWLLVRAGDPAAPDAAARFAPLAVGSLVLLWVTGTIGAIAVLGSVSALLTSTWGVLLTIKLAAAVAVSALALWGRRAVRGEPQRLGRVLATEAVLLVGVVVLSALVVGAVPDPTEGGAPQPTSQTLPVTAEVDVNLLVTPGATGPNEIHVTFLDDAGALTDRIESVTVEMTLPFAGIGPIIINGPEIEPGHFLVITENLTVAGVWRMDVVSRIGANELRRTTFEVPIND